MLDYTTRGCGFESRHSQYILFTAKLYRTTNSFLLYTYKVNQKVVTELILKLKTHYEPTPNNM